MARSLDVPPTPPPDVIATGEQWLSCKLNRELDILSNLIYLAERETDQHKGYLKIAKQSLARIRLMVKECHSLREAA
jgi:hypothetical protein